MGADRSALDALHEALGAQWQGETGSRAPTRYRAVEDEYRGLVEGRAVAERAWVNVLELTGADRRRFLHGLVSCDVQGSSEGASMYGFVTSPQGRVLADAVVIDTGDSLLVELPGGSADRVAAHLGKYVIADRVEIRPRADLVPLTLFGARAEEAAGTTTLAPAEWSCERCSLLGHPVLADRRPVWGMPALTVWVETPAAATLLGSILEGARSAGIALTGLSALETRRVELGVPRFGRDFGAEHFPQETGLEERAVSYTKGCYLGQEVIARIHYRGQANRLMCGLLLDGEGPPDGAEVSLEGRPLGTLSSAVESPALGRWIALAVLHRRGAQPGIRVQLPLGEAVVAELPLVPAAAG
jgi:aminomethyltransferase